MTDEEKKRVASRLRKTLSDDEFKVMVKDHVAQILATFHLRSPMKGYADCKRRLDILAELALDRPVAGGIG